MELFGAALWPSRRGWHIDQRGHISLGLQERYARCTTLRRGLGSGDGKDEKKKETL
jgi:hypothetical protein